MTTPADQPDLIAFLRARLDDDEQTAPSVHALDCELTMTAGFHGPCTCGVPDRIEAEVDAKRRILGLVTDCGPEWGDGYTEAYRDVLRLLALPYASHPDYREEWRP